MLLWDELTSLLLTVVEFELNSYTNACMYCLPLNGGHWIDIISHFSLIMILCPISFFPFIDRRQYCEIVLCVFSYHCCWDISKHETYYVSFLLLLMMKHSKTQKLITSRGGLKEILWKLNGEKSLQPNNAKIMFSRNIHTEPWSQEQKNYFAIDKCWCLWMWLIAITPKLKLQNFIMINHYYLKHKASHKTVTSIKSLWCGALPVNC